VIEPRQLSPAGVAVVLMDFGQRERPCQQAAVVHEHPHHLKFFSQPADVGPAIDFLEAIDPTAGPGADMPSSLIRGEGIGLRVLSQQPAIGPGFAVVAVDMAAVVAGAVEKPVVNPQSDDPFAVGGAAIGPMGFPFVAIKPGRPVER